MNKINSLKKMCVTLGMIAVIAFVVTLDARAEGEPTIEEFAPVFDANYYYTHNADIQAACGQDANMLFYHFINYGMSEGRQASEEFNVYAYRSRYDDLKAAYGDDLVQYYLHYVYYGKAEGREAGLVVKGTTRVWWGHDAYAVEAEPNEMYLQEIYQCIDMMPYDVQYIFRSGFKLYVLDGDYDIENLFPQYYAPNVNVVGGIMLWEYKGDTWHNHIFVESTYWPELRDLMLCIGVDPGYVYSYDLNTLNARRIQMCTIHETAHALDYYFDYRRGISSEPEFESIYSSERASFMKTSLYKYENMNVFENIDEPREYFASAYTCYIMYPYDLLTYCPQTYRYIDDLMLSIR